MPARNKTPEGTELYRKELLAWITMNPNGSRKEFQTDFKKIFTYLYKNDSHWLDTHLPSKRKDLLLNREDIISNYRAQILDEIDRIPNITRTELWKKYSRACKYLYKNDLEWFEANMPNPCEKDSNVKLVDWKARDEEYYSKIKEIYPKLLALEKPTKISKKLFAKHLGIEILSSDRQSKKIPKTIALLDEITETVQDFRIRRCCIVIDRMLEKNGIVYFEKLREECAIESKNFKKIRPFLDNYIEQNSK